MLILRKVRVCEGFSVKTYRPIIMLFLYYFRHKNRQGLHVRLHEINAFLYIHIPVSTVISLLYVNEYIHVYLYVYTSSYYPCMYILISRK